MPFFAMPYRVLFHDTMAYGSHHYLTNFKFQNIARETILFESRVDGRIAWEEQLKNTVVLTREAYSFNMAPVLTGQRVAILLSYEDPSRSSVRLCFRVIRQDGQPVSCGYQTMVCIDKDTLEVAPAPVLVTQYLDTATDYCLLEGLTAPSFADRLKSGTRGVKDVFPDSVLNLGKYIANLGERESYWRIIDEDLREHVAVRQTQLPEARTGLVLTFPGQGSYRPDILRAIYSSFPETVPYFDEAQRITRELLGQDFLPAVLALSPAEESRLRAANPDIAQIGIYLAGALISKLLIDRDLRPELLLGHSFGELAALAAAGAYPIGRGVELVCKRVLALRASGVHGRMAAAACTAPRLSEILNAADPGSHSLEIAVVNHPRQTVVSGPSKDLEWLRERLARESISLTTLESPFPFHSSGLAPAVDRFRQSLADFSFAPPRIPVLHCIGQTLYSADADTAGILARQFVSKLDFAGNLQELRERGFHTFVECGSSDIVTRLVQKNFPNDEAMKALAAAPDQEVRIGLDRILRTLGLPALPAPEPAGIPDDAPPSQIPVAIVAMGCVLPGASGVDQYWQNIRNGVSGIVDIARIDPNAQDDFVAGRVYRDTVNIVPDKTYTLLNGSILEAPFDPVTLGDRIEESEFATLTRGQKLLALALGQSLKETGAVRNSEPARMQCILGATADGSSEFDEAALVETMQAELQSLDEPAPIRAAFTAELERVCGRRAGESRHLTQHRVYQQVVDKLLSGGVNTYVVDSACSSSLYAINLGIKALARRESDVVLAGGVFAPGPANNTLFAQFRGLSPTGSRPFDKDADGVVFGDGAAILVLRRLEDALADGERVLAVIRGMGLSSDGRSPSINVPQPKGQALAVGRALRQAAVKPETVQYIEAHATATPVGDKVELTSLCEVFKGRPSGVPPVELGSVKSLIGHTGWVSGAASVIKLCKAMEDHTIPAQHNFHTSDPSLPLEQSTFRISTEMRPWPENIDGYPRRAGVNGFGFGGTNAHLVLEEFSETYHRRLCQAMRQPDRPDPVCIVGVASLFPADGKLESPRPTQSRRFTRQAMRLPAKKILLPDVTEHMDATQFLVSLAAEKILDGLPGDWAKFREEAGVVVGLESKTERGLGINNRIFLDRLSRLFRDKSAATAENNRLLSKLAAQVRAAHIPSGPYTLPGLMPNVAASRVSSLFDLKGPNLVVDAGANSLFQALLVAEQLLSSGDCKIVFAGGVSAVDAATHAAEASSAEAAFLLAVTTEAVARECGLTVLAKIAPATEAAHSADPAGTFDYRGATGAVAIQAAMQQVQRGASALLREPRAAGRAPRSLTFAPAKVEEPASEATKVYAYVQGTPIHRFEPVLHPEPLLSQPLALSERKILVLTDQPSHWSALRTSAVLDALDYRAALPAPSAPSGEIAIDFRSEDMLADSLRALDSFDYDAILALKFLDGRDVSPLLVGDPTSHRGLLELLFAICRRDYARLRDARLPLLSLSLGAMHDGRPHPITGMAAGFLKSLARELPESPIAIVNTDELHFLKALRQGEAELGARTPDREVCYVNGTRQVFRLRPIPTLSTRTGPYIDSRSVILATGGGRGVTAVLTEELQSRFGCTVVAAGRTDLEAVPDHVRQMDEASFADYERLFYQEELARDPRQKIPELKRRFAGLQAANEVTRVIHNSRALPGRFEYRCADLSQQDEVQRLVADIYRQYGRIDLIVHGAGTQVSSALPKKSLADFRRIVDAKLASLAYIYQAVQKLPQRIPVHYHLLTSAFSYLGNDGQPDYGAANETMNRLAESMNRPEETVHWSSMAWLGWAGIGMTRGSEFAALAANRRLRGVTREEGRALFGELMAGPPTAPINILLADGEIQYYGVTVARPAPAKAPAPRKLEETYQWSVSLEKAPFLRDHLVHGVPTLPAAFLTCAVADAARKLRPSLKIAAYEDTHYHRFVRVPPAGAQFRVCASVLQEDDRQASVKVQILSDFVHKSGKVLQEGILHNETVVRMAAELPKPPARIFDTDRVVGRRLPDPYVLPGSSVQLNGRFASTRDIFVGPSRRLAEYKLTDYYYPESQYGYLLPNLILVDAFWRFGTVQLVRDRTLGVYVPVRCGVMRVYFDYTAFDLPELLGRMTFRGTNPTVEGDLLHVGPIDVSDPQGNVLLVVEDGVCRKFGEVALEAAAAHSASGNVL